MLSGLLWILFILNDPSYGTEHCDNARGLVHGNAQTEVTVFLMAGAVIGAKTV
jgi:sulfur relay (sulfurtransferase) complex TusBCD TusD component (DsrE family)